MLSLTLIANILFATGAFMVLKHIFDRIWYNGYNRCGQQNEENRNRQYQNEEMRRQRDDADKRIDSLVMSMYNIEGRLNEKKRK